MRIAAFRDDVGVSWGVVSADRISDARRVPGAPRDAQRLGTLEDRYRILAAGLAEVGFISRGSVVASC